MASHRYTVADLAVRVDGEVFGDGARIIAQLKSLERATADSIAYVKDHTFLSQAQAATAACLIVTPDLAKQLPQHTLIVVPSPYAAFARLTHVFDPRSDFSETIDPTAQVASTARIGKRVHIGAYCIIGENVHIGDDSVVLPHSFIDNDVTIGEQAYIEAHVSIGYLSQIGARVRIHAHTTIASEGFGFAPLQGQWHRIVQLGRVVIGDDVRIGANCCIDRGALDDTIIENGVIIDNLVQIAHNVQIGAHTAIAAKCGIAGSTRIGKHCILGGATGVAGHLTIADHVHFTAMSMVTKSIHQAGIYSSGTGVMANQSWKRAVVGLRQLAQYPLQATFKKIEQRLQQLEQNSNH